MQTFLEDTITRIKNKHKDLSSLTIVLPSKRAGGFLLNLLKEQALKTFFAPKIISIEEFIELLAGKKIISHTELLFKSYEAYLQTSSATEKDDFETYTSWATTLLNDFNEIDRYLISPQQFFNYLASIQDINHWYLKKEKTSMIENYLKFWNSLYEFYENLKKLLLNEEVGYQGLVYREAAESVEHYLANNGNAPHVFIGFNALNKAEEIIVQELLETGHSEIYWDHDKHFYSDPKHSASHFIRKYVANWKYYSKRQISTISNNFTSEKKIQFVEVEKNIGQVKYVGQLLSKLSSVEIDKTVIVLADEHLLIPLLHSLPSHIKQVNITMGAPLKSFPITGFFESLLSYHAKVSTSLYFRDVFRILNHPIADTLISDKQRLINRVSGENIIQFTVDKLVELDGGNNADMLYLLFGDWNDSSTIAIQNCRSLLLHLLESNERDRIEQMVLYELFSIFEQIESLNLKFNYLKSISSTHYFFQELVAGATLDFKGDAYNGLQIMGVLETRVLDFEHVIITSVNEGILPSGKSNSSYITYDLKQQFGLPLYTDKDAIYTYHFYRLLHRAKLITLLYNNFTEGLKTGEKSRYITQLEVDKIPIHIYENTVVSVPIGISKGDLKNIIKTEIVMQRIKEIAYKGFSPSALVSYIRNPLDFYYQKILKIDEFQEVEEVVAANTLGTIVHDTLESIYAPLENKLLTRKILEEMKLKIDTEVKNQFNKSFKAGSFKKGKNLLIFEVAKRYILNFINFEISEINSGNEIKIIKIENELELEIPIPEIDFPVKIRGKIDRLDTYNGDLRVIDYKTGFVKQSDLEVVDWQEITTDYKFSKIIQVLAYAIMIQKEFDIENAFAGIISFKNLGAGYLKFGVKSSSRSQQKEQQISRVIIDSYLIELKKLILEICDQKISFTEKEL